MRNNAPLIIGIETTALTEQDRINLLSPLVSGVILFTRNFESKSQLQALCASIKAIKSPELLICVDQEGGRVQRFKEGFTRLPPLAVYGVMAEANLERACDYSYRHGRVMAGELRAYGVDLSFAPVLDVQSASTVIGDRAFSDKPEHIAKLGEAMLAGMRDAGMASTGKHFPGHGSVLADTHTELVTDERDFAAINQYDMAPFVALSEKLQAVMMAHVCYPCVAPEPAGYSRNWVVDVLQQQVKFKGAIISDDLDMLGGAGIGDLKTRLLASLEAGCHLALVCNASSATQLLEILGDVEVCSKDALKQLMPTTTALSIDEMNSVGEWRQWQQSLAALTVVS